MAAAAQAQAPRSRPTWLVVLAVLALLAGAWDLFGGLTALKDPTGTMKMDRQMEALSGKPGGEAAMAEMSTAVAAVVEAHKGGIRVAAVAGVIVGLLYLYAAAMALSLDRVGRRAFIVAACANLANAALGLTLTLPFMREMGDAMRGPMMKVIASAAEGKGAAQAGQWAGVMGTVMMAFVIGGAVISVGFSLLLFAYFGGKKGRTLYGLESAPADGG